MDYSQFVGLPWRDRGRGPDAYDCWGLFRLAFGAATGIDLPSHDEHYRSAADRNETALVVAGGRGDWDEVPHAAMRELDGAVFVMTGRFHIGLVVRRGLVLHMPFQGTSVIAPLSRFPKPTLYRHREL